jgi:hypothetical protein
MKLRKLELFFLTAILIVSCFTLIVVTGQRNTKSSSESEKEKFDQLFFELYIKQNIAEGVINNHLYLNLSDKKEGFFVERDKPILVYRYSAINCHPCVRFGISKIEEHFAEYKNSSKVLHIISEFPSSNENPRTNVLDLQRSRLRLPVENTNQPYYFVLINNYVQHVFVPEENFPEQTDVYLREIKKRYFND